jgi:hypothetical protein
MTNNVFDSMERASSSHNEEQRDLNGPGDAEVVKCRRVRCAEYIARIGKMGNAWCIFGGQTL